MNNVKELAKKLPDACATILPSTGEAIVIHFGVSGYCPVELFEGQTAASYVEKFNRLNNVDPIQIDAMETGSMFGWEVPGADPDYLRKMYAKKGIVRS